MTITREPGMFKRILLKLSGEYLAGDMDETGGNGSRFDVKTVGRITDEIKNVRSDGVEVCVVIGGGNFWRGAEAPESMDRVKADHIGMLASVMNGIYLVDFYKSNGMAARVLTPVMFGSMTEVYNSDAADKYLSNGEILIFAGGTGHPFFSTDTIAAIRAAELRADCVLYAKGVEGVCDKNPKKLKSGEEYGVYREITYNKMIRDNLTVVDIVAAELLRQRKIDSVLFDIRRDKSIETACRGDDEIFEIGTKIYWDRDKDWEEKSCLTTLKFMRKK